MGKIAALSVIVAVLKILIEYRFYKLKKSEFWFHFVGFTIISAIFGLILFLVGWKEAVTYAVVYWNAFEMVGNLAHGQNIFYVGETSKLDKLIRDFSPDTHLGFITNKALLHILTLLILLFI